MTDHWLALDEMVSVGHIVLIEEDPSIINYVTASGIHFYKTKKKYRTQAIWKYIEDMSKRWGLIITLLTLIAANIWQFVSYKQKSSEIKEVVNIVDTTNKKVKQIPH